MAIRTGRKLIEVTGSERVSWLNGLITCDVRQIQDGGARFGAMVERKGKIVSDVVVAAPLGAERLWIDVDAQAAAQVLEQLEHHLIMEDVELRLLDGAVGVRRGATAAAGEACLPLVGLCTGEGGLLWTGIAAGEMDDVYDEVRFEAGWPAFRVDYDESFYPQEAAIEGFAVAFDKGCYLGQEVVFMLQARGKVKRRLALVQVEGEWVRGARVADEAGKDLGEVRSVRGARAFALVQRSACTPGTRLVSDAVVATVLG